MSNEFQGRSAASQHVGDDETAEWVGLGETLSYPGPERRGAKSVAMARLMVGALDELDYAMVLVAEGGMVLHANRAARQSIDDTHPLQIQGRRLRGRTAADHQLLAQALLNARERAARSMLDVGAAGRRVRLSVTPLPAAPGPGAVPAMLVTLQRAQIVEPLSAAAFGRAHGLSGRESEVLAAVCEGLSPNDIALRLNVSRATVRTHIHSIKSKTHTDSLSALLQQLAVLPPIVTTLRA